MGRPHPALIELAAGRPLPSVSDPDQLVASAIDHRVAPLLLHELRLTGHSLGLQADRRLAFEDLAHVAHLDRVVEAFGTAVGLLSGAGFDVGVAKGVAAAQRWWPNWRLRPCNDVDLWINPADIRRLDEFVEVLAPGHPLGALMPKLAAANAVTNVGVMIRGVSIDIHTDILNLIVRTRQRDLLWSSTEAQTCNGSAVRALRRTHAIAHLAINMLRDGFPLLVQLVDLRHALEQGPLDWSELADFVDIEGYGGLVFGSLQYSCGVLGIPYDGPPPPRRSDYFLRALYPISQRLGGQQNLYKRFLSEYLLPLAGATRSREAAAAIARRTFPPDEVLSLKTDAAGPYLRKLLQFRIQQRRQAAALRLPDLEGQAANARDK